jgi:hypothetical protein
MALAFTGLNELKAELLARGQTMTGKGVVRALQAGGAVVAEAMIAAAPMLDEKTTNSTSLAPGALKESIRVRVKHVDGETYVLIGPTGGKQFVGGWVEYGHRLTRGKGRVLASGKLRGFGVEVAQVQAHPWARPAWESSIDRAVEAMTASLRETWTTGKIKAA